MPDRSQIVRGEKKDEKDVASTEGSQFDVATELTSIKTMLQGSATEITGVKAILENSEAVNMESLVRTLLKESLGMNIDGGFEIERAHRCGPKPNTEDSASTSWLNFSGSARERR